MTWAASQLYIGPKAQGFFCLQASFQDSQLSGFSTFIWTSLLFHIEIIRPEVFKYAVILSRVKGYKEYKLPEMLPQLSTASNIRHGEQAYIQAQLCRPGLEVHNNIRLTLMICNDRTAKPAKRTVFMYEINGALLWKASYLPTNIPPSLHMFLWRTYLP